jgi:uncharacterized protein (TIGR00369 family)
MQDKGNLEGRPVALLREQVHPDCCVCCRQGPLGLRVDYRQYGEGKVEAVVGCPDSWQGYPEWVHGGVVAALLDGAMTNCLFFRGIAAVTADLNVRYRHPLRTGKTARVVAGVKGELSPLFVMEASILQDGLTCATAVGKFISAQFAERAASPEPG